MPPEAQLTTCNFLGASWQNISTWFEQLNWIHDVSGEIILIRLGIDIFLFTCTRQHHDRIYATIISKHHICFERITNHYSSFQLYLWYLKFDTIQHSLVRFAQEDRLSARSSRYAGHNGPCTRTPTTRPQTKANFTFVAGQKPGVKTQTNEKLSKSAAYFFIFVLWRFAVWLIAWSYLCTLRLELHLLAIFVQKVGRCLELFGVAEVNIVAKQYSANVISCQASADLQQLIWVSWDRTSVLSWSNVFYSNVWQLFGKPWKSSGLLNE